MKKSVGILTFEKFEGRENIGSSRIRGKWLANNWDNAEIFVQGKAYDVTIYQKAYWLEHMKMNKGIKILDICDPDWLHWSYRIKQVLDEMDGIVTSTQALADDIQKFTDKPVIYIPDRIDLNEFKKKKVHNNKAKYAVWFGYSNNFEILKPVIRELIKKRLGLIVLSNKPFCVQANYKDDIEVIYHKFKEDTYHELLMQGDIVINPKAISGKWKYKSENKTLIAWALGLPVAKDVDDLERFMDKDERVKEIELRTEELKNKWDVKKSVEEYKKFIEKISKERSTL